MRINSIELQHDLGDIFYRKFLGKEFMCDNHNYLRIYYVLPSYHHGYYSTVIGNFTTTLVPLPSFDS